jgi:hypothetical protein
VAERTREIRRKEMSYNMYVPSVNLVSFSWMKVCYSLQKAEESGTRKTVQEEEGKRLLKTGI